MTVALWALAAELAFAACSTTSLRDDAALIAVEEPPKKWIGGYQALSIDPKFFGEVFQVCAGR